MFSFEFSKQRLCILTKYVTELINKHNNLCNDVNGLNNEINEEKDLYQKLTECHNLLVDSHNTLLERVNYVIKNWESEWDGGSSWKDGLRPDGSSVEDD